MNSTVNKWQVLHFLLLSIMSTSLCFCSIQRVSNANGLKNTFADLQPPRKKNIHEQNSKPARLFPDLGWTSLSRTWEAPPKHGDWVETHFIQVIHIRFGAIRSTPAARLGITRLESQSYLCDQRVIKGNSMTETGHGQHMARCPLCPSNITAFGLLWSIFIAHARLYHSPGASQLLCFLHFACGKWKFMIKWFSQRAWGWPWDWKAQAASAPAMMPPQRLTVGNVLGEGQESLEKKLGSGPIAVPWYWAPSGSFLLWP